MSRPRRPWAVVAHVLGGGVIVVVLAAGLASAMGRGGVAPPAVAVSREAAIKIAAANLGLEATLRSTELETMGAPNATPTPCHSAAVQVIVIVNAQTGEILTTATQARTAGPSRR